jgi:hypothetical protein
MVLPPHIHLWVTLGCLPVSLPLITNKVSLQKHGGLNFIHEAKAPPHTKSLDQLRKEKEGLQEVAQEQEDQPNSCSFKCTPQRRWYLRSKTCMQLWPTWSRKPGRA